MKSSIDQLPDSRYIGSLNGRWNRLGLDILPARGFLIRYQMEMQLRDVLVHTAVGDQAIAAFLQLELSDQALHGQGQLAQEGRVGDGQIHERGIGPFGRQQDVQRVAGLWVMKGDQGFGLTQALDRDGKTHVPEHPTDQILTHITPGEELERSISSRLFI